MMKRHISSIFVQDMNMPPKTAYPPVSSTWLTSIKSDVVMYVLQRSQMMFACYFDNHFTCLEMPYLHLLKVLPPQACNLKSVMIMNWSRVDFNRVAQVVHDDIS